MGVIPVEQKFTSSIAPKRLFKALYLENHHLIPKLVPHRVKNIDIIEGDGGVGTIKQINFVEGGMKNMMDTLDAAPRSAGTKKVKDNRNPAADRSLGLAGKSNTVKNFLDAGDEPPRSEGANKEMKNMIGAGDRSQRPAGTKKEMDNRIPADDRSRRLGVKCNYMKYKVDTLDVEHCSIKFCVTEGDVLGDKLELVVFGVKFEAAGKGSFCKMTVRFHPKGEVEPTKEQMDGVKDRFAGFHKVVEDYLVANPSVYA